MISSSPPVTTTDVRCGRCGSAVTAEGDTCTHCLLTDLMGPEGEEIFSCDQMEAVPSLKSGGGFILGDEIGHGGMGQVFRAQQISPAREVAVKLLMPHLLSSAESRRRFLAEGAAMAELEHPGILPLYACGEEDGRPWIAMKLATGGSLSSQRAKWVGRWIEACKLVALLADAMQHAHARGLIHRDLKPANILLDEAGRPWVADFGLAKWRQSEGHFTLSQELMGTPAYMAPEVAAEGVKGATTASDIYGLGAILYELLTGQPPYIDKSPVEILRKLSSADPTPPRSVQPAVPRDLEVVCLRAMDREPGKRYETAALFAADLRRYLSGQPVLARPQSTREKFGRWVRQHPWPAGLAAALALVTGISGAMIVNQNKTLRSRNDALTNALAGWKIAQRDAEDRVTYAVEILAPQLEELGRSDIMSEIYADIGGYFDRRQEPQQDGVSLMRRVKFLLGWGRNFRHQGNIKIAGEKIMEARKLAEQAVAVPAPAAEAWIAQADALRAAAEYAALTEEGSTQELLERATAAVQTGLTSFPDHAGLLRCRADVYGEQCDQWIQAGKTSLADLDLLERHWEAALAVQPLASRQQQRQAVSEHAKVPYYRGIAAGKKDDWAAAESSYRDWLKVHQSELEKDPHKPILKFNVALAQGRLSQALQSQSANPEKLAESKALSEESDKMIEWLYKADDQNARFRAEYALSLMHRARPLIDRDDTQVAEILSKAYEALKDIPVGTRAGIDDAKQQIYRWLPTALSRSGQGESACRIISDALQFGVEKYQENSKKWSRHLAIFAEGFYRIHEKYAHQAQAIPALAQAVERLNQSQQGLPDWPEMKTRLEQNLHNLQN